MFKSFFSGKKSMPQENITVLTFQDGHEVEVLTQYHPYHDIYVTFNLNRQTQHEWGHTFDESLVKFQHLYLKYLNRNKGGRPKKDNVVLYCRVPKWVKDYITNYCAGNKINNAQFLEQLIELHQSQCINNCDTAH